ncbi:MAB_1171c family putative transporter [Streptomyces sp. NPDC001889]
MSFLSILAAAVAWKLYQLSRDPHNAPLRAVTLCLVCAAASYPLSMPGGARDLDAVLGHGAAKLGQNLLLLGTLYFLMCFYLYSAADAEVGRRRARREAVAVLIVGVVITVAVVTAPDHDEFVSYSEADMTVPQVAVFWLVAGAYMVYALAAAGWWTRRYARMSDSLQATGLWLAAAGMRGMAIASALRAVFVIVRSQGGDVPDALTKAASVMLVLSIPLFVIGISYAGARSRLAAMKVSRHHRAVHRQLEPLWNLLSEIYPATVLRPASLSWRDRWLARGVHRRYHRRIVECRDGLVRISPYLHPSGQDTAALDLHRPEILAQQLRTAAEAVKAGAPAPRQAIPLAMPQDDDRDADVRQLVALSNALNNHPATAPANKELTTC